MNINKLILPFLLCILNILIISRPLTSHGKENKEEKVMETRLGVFVTIKKRNVLDDDLYSSEELASAFNAIDIYFQQAITCAKNIYPKLTREINKLQPDDLYIAIVPYNFIDQDIEKGVEGYFCTSASTGNCGGEFHYSTTIGFEYITTPPALTRLSHEIGHWLNYKLFGSTDNDSEDLSELCYTPPLCHRYSTIRSRAGCKN